jgi:hypothetical protein
LCEEALTSIFDDDLYNDLQDQEIAEAKEFKKILKRDFNTLLK